MRRAHYLTISLAFAFANSSQPFAISQAKFYLPDLANQDSRVLLERLEQGLDSWEIQVQIAQTLFNRHQRREIEAVEHLLVWPRIRKLTFTSWSSFLESHEAREIVQLGRIAFIPLRENLFDSSGHTDTRKWSALLIGKVASFDEGFPVLVNVVEIYGCRSTGDLCHEQALARHLYFGWSWWHAVEAQNGLCELLLRQPDAFNLSIQLLDHHAKGVRNAAVEVLGTVGRADSRRVEAELLARLEDLSVGSFALETTFGKIADSQTALRLIEVFLNGTPSIASKKRVLDLVAAATRDGNYKDVRDQLIGLLENRKFVGLHADIIRTLGQILHFESEWSSRNFPEFLVKIVEDEKRSEEIRLAAIEQIYKDSIFHSKTGVALSRLAGLLRKVESDRVRVGLSSRILFTSITERDADLDTMKKRERVDLIVDIVSSVDLPDYERMRGVEILELLGLTTPEALVLLLRLERKDPSPEIRNRAGAAVRRMKQ